MVGRDQVITVEEKDGGALARRECPVSGRRRSRICLLNDPHTGPLERAERLARTVRRPVVHDNEFNVWVGLHQHRLSGFADVSLGVIGWHKD